MRYDELLNKFEAVKSSPLPARLFRPLREKGRLYPLVLFLHGMGERGSDNAAQITNTGGAHLWAWDHMQMDHPCYILAPQCPDGKKWIDADVAAHVMQTLDVVRASEPIDDMRIYICGLSMGGCGTWRIAADNPGVFAAAVPVCGAAAPHTAARIGQLPLWAFHSVDDRSVPIAGDLRTTIPSLADEPLFGSRLAVSEAARCGARNIRLTEYPEGYIAGKYGGAHACWEEAFRDDRLRKWLFSQERIRRDTYSLIVPGVWECSDAAASSYYIVEGKERALVIDTGMGKGDINAFIRSVTHLPYELALTHGHGDHSMHCSRFDRVYLDMADKEFLFGARFDGQQIPDESRLVHIEDGRLFDLGGGVDVEVISLHGHTPGSVIFVDRFHKCVFTGDAIGSGCGVWMQVPMALSLTEYAEAIARAEKRLADIGVDATWAFLGGHAAQRFQSSTGPFNPVLPSLFSDMRALCEKLVSGEITGAGEGLEGLSRRFGASLKASYATAEIFYRPEQLK